MNRFFDGIKKLIPTKRKLIQLYTALLFNVNLKGFKTGNIYQGATKQMCVPGLNCYSCPGAVGACPLGSLQGSFSADKSTFFYVGGILLLYSVLFGRMICGWACPFGLIQELLYKIKTPKLPKNRFTRALSFFKYVVLGFFVFVVPIMYAFRDTPLPAFCKYICPAGTLEGGIGLLSNRVNEGYFSMLGPLFTWKFLLLVSIVTASIFIFRMFCRFICPLGALYGLFNRFSVFGVKLDKHSCTNCGLCTAKCKMDVRTVGDCECIQCGECIDVCPVNALSWKSLKPSKTLYESSCEGKNKTKSLVTRAVSCILLLALLVGAAAYYWQTAPDAVIPQEDQTEQGNQVGDLCFSSDLSIVTPDGISGDTVDPTDTGKITIINFWGTWCTPCVNELPYFAQIASDYADDVSVIAVHTNMIIETAPEYIKNHYPDSLITFASDLTDEGYYKLLGGRGTYPYTVVLDADGRVVRIFLEALEYEDLQSVVEEQLDK